MAGKAVHQASQSRVRQSLSESHYGDNNGIAKQSKQDIKEQVHTLRIQFRPAIIAFRS